MTQTPTHRRLRNRVAHLRPNPVVISFRLPDKLLRRPSPRDIVLRPRSGPAWMLPAPSLPCRSCRARERKAHRLVKQPMSFLHLKQSVRKIADTETFS